MKGRTHPLVGLKAAKKALKSFFKKSKGSKSELMKKLRGYVK